MGTLARSSLPTVEIKSVQPEYFRYESHCQEMIQWLHSRVDLCDVILIVGESKKRIAAHRWILMACSDYFSNVLSEPIYEGQQREVTLVDVDEDATEKVINYCYTGSLEIDGNTIATLLSTANQLRLQKAVDGCCEFLQRHLQPTNVLDVFFLAEQLNLDTFYQNILKFICENFEEVSNQPTFLLLSFKQLSEFISADDLGVTSEKFVFDVVMKWIEFDPETRKKHFVDLLARIRLPLLPPDFLMEKVEPLCRTIESKDLILSAIKAQHLVAYNQRTCGLQPRSYLPNNVVKQLLVFCTRKPIKQDDNLAIAVYNITAKLWTICNSPIKCKNGFGVALMNDELIAVAGVANGSHLKTVSRLNLRTMISTEMPSLGTVRSRHAVAVLNGSIYVIGGYDGRQDLNSVERWDTGSQTWNLLASMKTRRQFPAVAVTNDRLYVSGGACDDLSSMECYDPVENIWRSKASVKVKRRCHCLAVFNGYLFAIGGWNSQSLGTPVERYDPLRDTWTMIPCSITISGYTRCSSVGSEIYIYNNSKIYVISDESTYDKLELRNIEADSINISENYYDMTQFVAIPFECNPAGIKF